MVAVFWPAALTKTELLVTVVVALSLRRTELTTGGLGTEDGQQVMSLCTDDSGTLRPRSNNINGNPLSTASYTSVLVDSPNNSNRKSSPRLSNSGKMAMPMRRTLVALHRSTCSSLKCAETSLEQPGPLFLPVRTKKRYFIPPSVGMKGRENPEAKARAAGVVFRQQYFERPINIACSAGIFDPYIPPEGDARLSSLSKEGLKQRTEQIRQTAASQLAIRKIKEHDSDFTSKGFAERAQEIFIEAHNALAQFNKEQLHSLVTERCYPEMTRGNRYKTIRWTFVESLEPPKVVHARCPDMVTKGNLYGQVTVRMHSKQTLAIYDRFGRLMLGSEEQPKDVLEYLVMERHIVNPYSRWRLHGKIVPSWAPAKDPVIKTVMIPGPDLKPGEEFDALNYQVPKPAAVQWSK